MYRIANFPVGGGSVVGLLANEISKVLGVFRIGGEYHSRVRELLIS